MALTADKAALSAILTAWQAAWNAATYPYVVGDVEFQAPRQQAWVRLSVQNGEATRRDLGSTATRHEFPGVITVQCFIPRQPDLSPEWVAADISDAVREIYQDKEFETEAGGQLLTYTTAAPRRLPPEAGWQRFNIQTPFQRFEV